MTQKKTPDREPVAELSHQVGVCLPKFTQEPGLNFHSGASVSVSALYCSSPTDVNGVLPPPSFLILQWPWLSFPYQCHSLSGLICVFVAQLPVSFGSSAATPPALRLIEVQGIPSSADSPLLSWPWFFHSSKDCNKTHSSVKVPGFSP